MAIGVLVAPAAAFAAGSISGTVTAASDDEPIADVEVCAWALGPSEDFECAATAVDGTYAIGGLAPGDYKVEFWAASLNYVLQYYNAKPSWEEANVVEVIEGVDTPNINAALDEGGQVEGRVIDAVSKAAVEGATVCFRPQSEFFARCQGTDANGEYALSGLVPGSYEVVFFPGEEDSEYITQSYASPVTVTAGSTTSGVNAELRKGGQIVGTITDALSGAGVPFGIICLVDALEGEVLRCVRADSRGRYAIKALPTGSYKVWFSPDVPEWKEEDDYVQQYYDGKPNFAQASPLTVIAPGMVSGIDARLMSRKAVFPVPVADTPTVPPPLSSVLRPRPKKCSKGKRLVRVKGKARCVKIQRKRHHGRR